MKRVFVTAIAASIACASAANAQNYPKAAFDATYTQSTAAGNHTLRMLSDGKGRMRTEMTINGMKMCTISDYPNKTAYSIMDAQKMVMQVPLKETNDVRDAESAKKANAKSLGQKVISGHPCHGWEYTSEHGKTTVWTGDDINYLVKSETVTSGGQKVSMELQSLKAGAPPADQFQVPPSYRLMSVPGR